MFFLKEVVVSSVKWKRNYEVSKKRKKYLKNKKKFTQIKLIRAYSECLGTIWRRRTRLPAKSYGELEVSIDP